MPTFLQLEANLTQTLVKATNSWAGLVVFSSYSMSIFPYLHLSTLFSLSSILHSVPFVSIRFYLFYIAIPGVEALVLVLVTLQTDKASFYFPDNLFNTQQPFGGYCSTPDRRANSYSHSFLKTSAT